MFQMQKTLLVCQIDSSLPSAHYLSMGQTCVKHPLCARNGVASYPTDIPGMEARLTLPLPLLSADLGLKTELKTAPRIVVRLKPGNPRERTSLRKQKARQHRWSDCSLPPFSLLGTRCPSSPASLRPSSAQRPKGLLHPCCGLLPHSPHLPGEDCGGRRGSHKDERTERAAPWTGGRRPAAAGKFLTSKAAAHSEVFCILQGRARIITDVLSAPILPARSQV